jgi:hypothetical protein
MKKAFFLIAHKSGISWEAWKTKKRVVGQVYILVFLKMGIL